MHRDAKGCCEALQVVQGDVSDLAFTVRYEGAMQAALEGERFL